MTNRIAILGALALLAGCPDDTDKTATGDTAVTPTMPTGDCPDGVYDGPTLIQSATVTCVDDSTVLFQVDTDGWTGDGVIFSQETGNVEPQFADEHDIESVEFDLCGYSDHLEQELTTGVSDAKATTNESTVFRCDTNAKGAGYHHNAPVMTYAAAVYDIDGNFADCMVWGDDPTGLIDGTYNRLEDPSFAGELGNCVIGDPTR